MKVVPILLYMVNSPNYMRGTYTIYFIGNNDKNYGHLQLILISLVSAVFLIVIFFPVIFTLVILKLKIKSKSTCIIARLYLSIITRQVEL